MFLTKLKQIQTQIYIKKKYKSKLKGPEKNLAFTYGFLQIQD